MLLPPCGQLSIKLMVVEDTVNFSAPIIYLYKGVGAAHKFAH